MDLRSQVYAVPLFLLALLSTTAVYVWFKESTSPRSATTARLVKRLTTRVVPGWDSEGVTIRVTAATKTGKHADGVMFARAATSSSRVEGVVPSDSAAVVVVRGDYSAEEASWVDGVSRLAGDEGCGPRLSWGPSVCDVAARGPASTPSSARP